MLKTLKPRVLVGLLSGLGVLVCGAGASAQGLRPISISDDTRSFVAPQGGFGLLDPRLFSGSNRIITIQPGVAVPPYALPPGNWQRLLRPPMDWDHGPIVLSQGPYTPGDPIDPNTAVPAGACWAVPAAAPSSQPPNGFMGRLILPDGAAWAPGTAIPPNAQVWAWMCANWKWRAIVNQPVSR